MRIELITIFPEYFAPLGLSLIGRARERGLLHIGVHDLRAWTDDPHHRVDDTPYGGGPGMVMTPEPWGRALDAVAAGVPPPRLLVPTPSGRRFSQRLAERYRDEPRLIIACARYEGMDARVTEYARQRMPVDELSLGDYVLAGGEAAALVIVETVTRLLPGVVGNSASIADDSFGGSSGGPADRSPLEGPVYTRPARWRGLDVPAVLLSGDHAAVGRWRQAVAHRRTAAVRPDLLCDPSTGDPSAGDPAASVGSPTRETDHDRFAPPAGPVRE